MRALVIAVAFCLSSMPANSEEYFGKFEAGPEGRFVDQRDRPNFELVKEFSFEDPNGTRWTVPKGTRVDGASIPQAFWSMIGGPFEGRYLKASVVHDHFCNVRTRTAHDTHRNFYYGMRADRVPEWQAQAMYWAVSAFGPSWRIEKRINSNWDCRAPTDGVPTCTTIPTIENATVVLPSIDLGNPEVLAIALGKFNAIARTLKTSEGSSLDIVGAGQVSASLDSIEANAANFRNVMATESFRDNPMLVGILSEPKRENLNDLESWPRDELPVLATTPTLSMTRVERAGPLILEEGDIAKFQGQLELKPTTFNMPEMQ